MTTLVESIKPDIITVLSTGNKTISQIAQALGVNYYTVRNAVRDLVKDQQILTLGYPGTRNVKYGLQDDSGLTVSPTNTIPRFILNGTSHRVTDILGMETREQRASTSIRNLPKHVARLCNVAERFASDDNTATLAMESVRVEMHTDLKALEAAVETYKQILLNKRNWDPDTLKTWVDDPAYDSKKVQTTNEFFNES